MNAVKVPNNHFDEYVEISKPPGAGEIIRKYIYHWPLFALVMAICLALAFGYLKVATPGYTARARLMIKDDAKGNGTEPALQELNLFKTRALVENEMEVLMSRTLMDDVVKDLMLHTNYYIVGGFKNKTLYSERPVTFIMLAPKKAMPINTEPIEIEILNSERFLLKEGKSSRSIPYSATMTSAIGKWKLAPSASLDAFKGKTIRIVYDAGATDHYVASLEAELSNKKSTVVELSFKDQIPQRGVNVLNHLIKRYNQASIQDKNNVRLSTLSFINERLASLSGELSSAEKNVESFKSDNTLMDIPSESGYFLDRVKENDAKLNEVNVRLEVVRGIEQYVNSSRTGNAPATAGIDDQGLISLINQLIGLELKKDQMLGTTPATSPAFETLDRQINSTKHSIRENIGGLKSSLMTSRRQLQGFNAGFETSIKKLPGQERELITKKRQQSIKEELYVYLLQKREEADVSYASTIVDTRMVDLAHVGAPDSPKGMLVYGMAMIAGFLLPFGLITGRSLLNNKITNKREIQQSTSLPIIGELVFQKPASQLVMHDRNRQMIAEQFRALNTNVQHLYQDKQNGRITLLTSGAAGEGKSFITCNLAASLAASGRKTVILEFDLRNPSVFKNLNLGRHAGIVDYLEGKSYLSDIILPSQVHKNLFVVSAGAPTEYPSELLQGEGLTELFEQLSKDFDEILVDTPPIQLVADALILSKFSDINLFVVRHGVTSKSQLEYLQELHIQHRLKNINVIFNGVDIAEYGGSYNYGYYTGGKMSIKESIELGTRNLIKRL